MQRNNALQRGRGRRSRRGRVQRGVRLTNRFVDRAAYRGLVPMPSFIPPRVLYTPWNSLVVSWQVVGTATASNRCLDFFADLTPAFRAQCGLPASVDVGYRLVGLQVWHLVPNGELNNIVRVRFMSLIEGITACSLTDTLAQVEDNGTIVRNASAKFVWPKTHSSNTFPSSSTRIFARLTLGAAQTVLVHATILWKFFGSSANLFNHDSFDHMFDSLSLIDPSEHNSVSGDT